MSELFRVSLFFTNFTLFSLYLSLSRNFHRLIIFHISFFIISNFHVLFAGVYGVRSIVSQLETRHKFKNEKINQYYNLLFIEE